MDFLTVLNCSNNVATNFIPRAILREIRDTGTRNLFKNSNNPSNPQAISLSDVVKVSIKNNRMINNDLIAIKTENKPSKLTRSVAKVIATYNGQIITVFFIYASSFIYVKDIITNRYKLIISKAPYVLNANVASKLNKNQAIFFFEFIR